jgi:hypothetical protein
VPSNYRDSVRSSGDCEVTLDFHVDVTQLNGSQKRAPLCRLGDTMMWRIFVTGFACAIIPFAATAAAAGEGLVRAVTSVPIVPDGDVAGSPTDLVIHFDTSADPSVPGRTLLRGKSIKVSLPDSFAIDKDLPLQAVFTDGCKPPDLECNTAVLLQGWPQRPIRPPKDKYELPFEGTHTLVFNALEDLVPMPPEEPGIKQAHLLLLGFANPAAG